MAVTRQTMIVGAAVLAVIAIVVMVKKKGAAAGVGAAIGGAAVDLANGVVSGVTFGVGDLLGVPRTDESRCAEARAAGDTWAASQYCTAGTFMGYAWDSATTAVGGIVPRVNPASDQNVIYSGVNGIGGAVTGEQGWTLGGAIYDWTH
jgi:hypothetical protein